MKNVHLNMYMMNIFYIESSEVLSVIVEHSS